MVARMMARSTQRELLDGGGQRDLDELRGNLRDMARYDRWLGAFGLLLRLAHRAPGDPVTGLDVGVGSAAFLSYARDRSAMRWAGLDVSGDVLRVAREAGAGALVCATGLCLPFADASIDVVTCAHTLHHLDPDDAAALLRECARAARRRVVVIDLARGPLTTSGAWLLTRLTSRNRMTREDGVLSARRAYAPREINVLAESAGLNGATVARHGPARWSLVWDAPASSSR
jgi:ubiquinone/menaquinone biosynthesis C-methylase UbiE